MSPHPRPWIRRSLLSLGVTAVAVAGASLLPFDSRAAAIAANGAAGTASAAAGRAPELVLVNGAIYRVDAARSWASAVAITDRRLTYVGDDAGARALAGPATRVVDLGGRMVLPGFADSHVHLVEGGVELGLCDLNEAQDAGQVAIAIAACARSRADSPWIVGGGWELPYYPDANPKREALDALVPDRPAIFAAADGHSAWVNSRALAIAGITAATPDPVGGRIERDPKSGEPSGTLRESAADLVGAHVPATTPAERLAGLERAVAMAHRFGITSALEASAGREGLEAFRELDRAGKLGLQVRVALYVDSEKGVEQVAELARLRDEGWGAHVVPATAKIFADGVLESGTAATLEPYVGRPGSGELNFPPPKFAEIAIALDRAGFQIHVHAIGDRGIRATLDALAAVETANGRRDRRPTMAHIELFDPRDIPRFRELGVAASFQPLWAYADPYITDLTEPFLGPTRSRWLYPIASMAATGAVLAAGSDWSVSSMNPLEGIETAVTRRDSDDPDGPGWIPDERVSLATMIAAYTIGSQWAIFGDRDAGSIEVGKYADLIVLDRNLFAIPPQQISETRVLWTLFGGDEVHRDPSFVVP